MSARLPILGADGKPLRNGTARKELADFYRKPVRATYDAASASKEYSNIWANSDCYDADSANSREVRHTLIRRSRYEIQNNGYSDGIAQTYATDLVGIGPTLRMQTGSQGFNQLIELEFYLWQKSIGLAEKLWCLAHAKHSDGEGFAVARTNPRAKHAIKLDLVLYEAEQVQTPYLPFTTPGYIDGIKFDEFGNAEYYDVLREHPGGRTWLADMTPEQVPAKYMLHWFKRRRPGQHRGVPEMASTLNTGAAARRWREATLAAAETAADFTTLLKTTMSPDEADPVSPMSSLDIQKRMMTALPQGWDVHQMKAEHPGSSFEAFHKQLTNEMARPKSMPFNKAACDSSSYNYASGRLDHQTYYASLDVERASAVTMVLDPLFELWVEEAIRFYGWLGGNPAAVSSRAKSHIWDWPRHAIIDLSTEASSSDTKLRNGTTSLTTMYAEAGKDFADEVPTIANDLFGDDEESGLTQAERNVKAREIIRNALFNSQNQQASLQMAEAQQTTAEANKEKAATPAAPVTAAETLMLALAAKLLKAGDDQPRDELGRFGEGDADAEDAAIDESRDRELDQVERSRAKEDKQRARAAMRDLEKKQAKEERQLQNKQSRELSQAEKESKTDEEFALREQAILKEHSAQNDALATRHAEEANALDEATYGVVPPEVQQARDAEDRARDEKWKREDAAMQEKRNKESA